MSFGLAPEPPPSGLNADPDRVQQRQSDDRAARAGRPHHFRPAAPDRVQRLVARVRTALRAPRSSR